MHVGKAECQLVFAQGDHRRFSLSITNRLHAPGAPPAGWHGGGLQFTDQLREQPGAAADDFLQLRRDFSGQRQVNIRICAQFIGQPQGRSLRRGRNLATLDLAKVSGFDSDPDCHLPQRITSILAAQGLAQLAGGSSKVRHMSYIVHIFNKSRSPPGRQPDAVPQKLQTNRPANLSLLKMGRMVLSFRGLKHEGKGGR